MEESEKSLLVVACLLALTSFLLGCGEDNPDTEKEKTWEEMVEESKKYCIAWVNDVAGFLYDLEFSPDGKYLGVAYGGGVELREPNTLMLLDRLETENGAYSLSFSGDGKMLVTGGWGKVSYKGDDHYVELWSVEQKERLKILKGHTRHVYDVDFSPDGKMVASASGDGTCRVWDVETGEEIGRFNGNGGPLKAVRFNPNGQGLAYADTGWKIEKHAANLYFVDLVPMEIVKTVDVGRGIETIVFSPDGKYIAIGGGWLEGMGGRYSSDACVPIDIWSTEDFELRKRWDTGCGAIWSLEYSPNGQYICSGTRGEALTQLWDTTSCQVLLSLAGHRMKVSGVDFYQDGKTFASGGGMGVIALWRVPEELLGKPKEEGGE